MMCGYWMWTSVTGLRWVYYYMYVQLYICISLSSLDSLVSTCSDLMYLLITAHGTEGAYYTLVWFTRLLFLLCT